MYLENIDDINVEVEQVATMGLDIEESGPPGEKGEPGLSAYEVYLNTGGTLTETEWLDSLKGEKGKDGADGKNGEDGYTPIKGTDYWTEDDKKIIENDMKGYIDNQLGVIENAYY